MLGANEASGQPPARGRGGRPSRLQSAQLADRILDVAETLFLSHGFGATSIEAVAKRAGISKRTFYHRFPGKERLFEAVVALLEWSSRRAPLLLVLEDIHSADGPSLELAAYAARRLDVVFEPRPGVKAILAGDHYLRVGQHQRPDWINSQ